MRDGEGGQFRRAADHQRDRGRRALVDVGHPHVERRRAELERQAGHDEHQAEHQHLVVDLAGWRCALKTSLMSSEPVAPYIIDMPYSRKPLAIAPSTKYFIAASVDVALSRRSATSA